MYHTPPRFPWRLKYLTRRLAGVSLDDVLAQARRQELPGRVATGTTVADAAAEWLRYCEHDRAVKASTLTEYRHTADRIVRDLGAKRLEDVTPEMLERWKSTLKLSNRSKEARGRASSSRMSPALVWARACWDRVAAVPMPPRFPSRSRGGYDLQRC